MSEPFVGQIVVVPYSWAPEGWAFCAGQLLPINQNEALYSLLGITYGGDGQNTFGVPDLRGRIAVGSGMGPNLPNFELGSKGGQVQQTLMPNQLPAHTHAATFTPSAGGGGTASGNVSLTVSGTFNTPISVEGSLLASPAMAATDVPSEGATLADVNPNSTRIYGPPSSPPIKLAPITSTGTASGTVTGTATGPVSLPVTASGGTAGTVTVQPNPTANQTIPTLPPYLVMNYTIALSGIYPPRP